MIQNIILFICQVRIIAYFLLYCYKKKFVVLSEQAIIFSIIFLNLLGGYDIILFRIHTSIVEPMGIACYFLSLFLYSWDKQKAISFFDTIYYTYGFMGCILFLLSQYVGLDAAMSGFIMQFLKNTVVSLMSLRIAFFIERSIFDMIKTKINFPYNQLCSVAIGQLFDTVVYTILIFYDKPIMYILQIGGFAYSIKILCIVIYGYYLSEN